MSQHQHAYAPDYASDSPKSSSRGCLFWGCLVVGVLMLVAAALLGVGGYWLFNAYSAQVEKYTSETPAELPTVELSEEELQELHQRIERFKAAVHRDEPAAANDPDAQTPDDPAAGGQAQDGTEPEQPEPPTELVLSADEINALIAEHQDWQRRAHVDIEDGVIQGQVSLPIDAIPRGEGRYFNASARFDVSMENGILVVRLTDATVKGEPVPEPILEGLRQQNLARDLYQDPEKAKLLRKFESVRVEDDRLVLKLRSDAVP